MSNPQSESYWDGIRNQFMITPGVLYLNNGSFGPSPRRVIETTTHHMMQLEENPAQYGEYWNRFQNAQKELAAFVGADPDDIAFILNVTVGMNMISRGLKDLNPGDEVLSTDQEYGAVNNAWEYLCAKKKLTLTRVTIPSPPQSKEQIVELMERSVTSKTRVMYFSHITTTTGLIMPVTEICSMARQHGVITAVDGAHGPGMIPLNISGLGCDFYTGNCHKWLCSPFGAGFLWAAKNVQDRLEPFIVGWGWKKDDESFLGNFENPGTFNSPLYLGVGEAVKFQLDIGREEIARRGRELARYAKEKFSQHPGVQVLTPWEDELSGSMASYILPPCNSKRISNILTERKIIVIAGADENGGRMRLSTHIYNNRGQIDILHDALAEAYGWSA